MSRNRKGNEPVDYTCPLIDSCIERMEAIPELGMGGRFEGTTIEELNNMFDSVSEFSLDEFKHEMELIRSANDELREWGCERDEAAIDAQEEVERLQGIVDELEKEKSELEDEVARLSERW